MKINVSAKKWQSATSKRSWKKLADHVASHYPKDKALHAAVRGMMTSTDKAVARYAKSAAPKRRTAKRSAPKRRSTAKRRTAKRRTPKRRSARRAAPKRRAARRTVRRRTARRRRAA